MAGASMKLAWRLSRRDDNNNNVNNGTAPFDGDGMDSYDDEDYSWWWSPTGMAIRYTIVLVILAAILVYFIGGRAHAVRRIRKGLPPKAYHAWMVRRYYRQPQPGPYYHQDPTAQEVYAMPTYSQPPPAYNPHTAPPPAYQPPQGASKVMADQNFVGLQTYRAEEHAEGSQGGSAPAAVARR